MTSRATRMRLQDRATRRRGAPPDSVAISEEDALGRPWLDPWVVASALVAAAAYAAWPREFSNIDEYNGRAFVMDLLGATAAAIRSDLPNGRFRPLYWVLEGALTSLTGSTATILAIGRGVFLALQVWLFAEAARRLGAGRTARILLALALAWSLPAQEVWTGGGPNEAFGNPLALACVLVVLLARTAGGVLLAVIVGFAAALCKETYGATTAAALAAFAASEFLRRRGGPARWIAVGGAALQLLPAAVATLGPRQFSSSYVALVVRTESSGDVVRKALAFNSPAVVLGGLGLLIVMRRLRRIPLREWPKEDLVVLALLAVESVALVGLGLGMVRYHLPLGTALLLVAARGARDLPEVVRRTARRRLGTAAVALVVLASGVQAAIGAEGAAADRRAMGRLRADIAESLQRYGAIRIFWVPHDVEQPMGAIAHLRIDGRATGQIELRPCMLIHPTMVEQLEPMFAQFSTPVSRPAPILVSLGCPGLPPAIPSTQDRACKLALPTLASLSLGLACHDVGDLHAIAPP